MREGPPLPSRIGPLGRLRKRVLPALVAFAAVASFAMAESHSLAAPPAGKTEFAAGRTKFQAKDYAAALPLFQAAWKATGSPNAGLYVGLCQMELGRWTDAFDTMSQTVREAEQKKATDPAY